MESVEQLFERHGRVEVLVVDDQFRRHMRERGRQITATDLAVVHGNPDTEYFDNEGYEDDPSRASIAMLGYASEGRFLTVPLDPTDVRGEWRPRTAYINDRDDEQRYRDYKQGGR